MLVFPDPAQQLDYVGPNGVTYHYNGSGWDAGIPSATSAAAAAAAAGAGPGPNADEKPVTVSATPPATPSQGDLWVDTGNPRPDLKVFDGSRWVAAVEGTDGIVDTVDPNVAGRQVLGLGVIDMGVMP